MLRVSTLLLAALGALPMARASTPALTPPEALWDSPENFYDETLDLSQYVVDPELQFPVADGINRSPAINDPILTVLENDE